MCVLCKHCLEYPKQHTLSEIDNKDTQTSIGRLTFFTTLFEFFIPIKVTMYNFKINYVQNIIDPYDNDVHMWVKISCWWHQGIIQYKSGCLPPAKSLHKLLRNASDNPTAAQGKIILAIRSGLAYVKWTSDMSRRYTVRFDTYPDSKDPRIDIHWTSIRCENDGSMTNWCRTENLCYLGSSHLWWVFPQYIAMYT